MPRNDPGFESSLQELADQARALAHPGRLRILQILARQNTCICGELVDQLPLAQSTVSQHLKELKRVGLITGEISGPRTCYCLEPAAVARMQAGFAELFAGLEPRPTGLEEGAPLEL